MISRISMLFLALAWMPGSVSAASGESLYQPCAACHGAQGEGMPALNSPALAGQLPGYLAPQLRHFKSGVRGSDPADTYGMQMRGMAATLPDDAAIDAVVAFIGTFPPADAAPIEDYDRRNGEVQYNAACGACHGARAQGNRNLRAPRLAGLDAVYLERQYRNFASGLRGTHPDDRLGAQMRLMATMLKSDKDLQDVIGFILAQ